MKDQNPKLIMFKLHKVFIGSVVILAFLSAPAVAQVVITGVVTDESGSGIPGVNVVIKGTTTGVATDAEGKFSIEARSSSTLTFSFTGFVTREIVVGNQTQLNVTLVTNVTSLAEIVIVGYGTQQRKDITGSVSSISQKDFQLQPVNRLDQALQGRVAGVQVTSNSGAPGGDVKIRVRGSNSISGDNNPLYIIDGFIGADFRNLNPDDIESIEVLKDASATAIYGSRGANGVILVTTKNGSSRGLNVAFTTRYTISSVAKKYDLLSAKDFAETVNQRNAVLGLSPTYSPEEIAQFQLKGGTDWQNEIFRNAGANEQLLSVSGGNDRTKFFFSGNYLDQDGVVINSNFKRYGFRLNLNSNITDKLSMRINFSGTRRENLNTGSTAGKASPVTQALAWAPTTPAYGSTGKYILRDPVGSISLNPLALAKDIRQVEHATIGNLVGGFNYEILDGLTFDIGYGIGYENSQRSGFTGNYASDNGQASAGRWSGEMIMLQSINNLTYTKIFNTIHNLTITGVFEVQSVKSSGFSAQASNLTFPALGADNLSSINAGGSMNTAAGYVNSGLRSFLGRVNYSFKDRYLITASLRQDASSKFKGANRTSLFPSVGLGWRISEEKFMKKVEFLKELKLRAGYGVTGNQGISPYGTFSNYRSDAFSAATAFDNASLSSGIILGDPGNSELKWETTAQSNVGLDVGLKNGWSFGIDYFKKNTSDLLIYGPVPDYAGGGVVATNAGKVRNHGVELYITGNIIDRSNFKWESSFNISTLRNEVVSLGSQKRIFTASNVGAGLSTQSEFVLMPGRALGSLWGVEYLGTWKPEQVAEAALFGAKPGDSRYRDVNGDKAITNDDFQVIGSCMPTLSTGWNNTLTYKNFSLNIFLQGLAGNDKLNYSYGVAVSSTGDARQATHSDVLGHYVSGTRESSNIPAFSTTDKTYIQSSRFVQSGDFIRVKNVSLSYALPQSLMKVMSVSVFVTATNLYTFTRYKGYDPESSSISSATDQNIGLDYGSYPNARSFTVGATLRLK